MIKFLCSEHGEQELKDSLMMSEQRGLILELMCSCTFKIVKERGKITQRRLTFTPAKAKV